MIARNDKIRSSSAHLVIPASAQPLAERIPLIAPNEYPHASE